MPSPVRLGAVRRRAGLPTVVAFPASGEDVGQVGAVPERRELLHGPAPRGRDQGGEGRRVDPHLVAPVGVQVQHLRTERLAPAQDLLGLGQVGPDGGAQVAQVEAAEDPVPVRVVALGPADRPPRVGRVAPLPAQRAERRRPSCASGSTRRSARGSSASVRRAAGSLTAGSASDCARSRSSALQPAGRGGGEGPPLHLPVRGRGEVRESSRPAPRSSACGGREQSNQVLRHERVQRVQEPLHPPLLPHPLGGPGPPAELLAVVGQHRQGLSRGLERAQVVARAPPGGGTGRGSGGARRWGGWRAHARPTSVRQGRWRWRRS